MKQQSRSRAKGYIPIVHRCRILTADIHCTVPFIRSNELVTRLVMALGVGIQSATQRATQIKQRDV